MQGILEAINYYYNQGNDIKDIFIEPKYQNQFQKLVNDAKQYYENQGLKL